MRSKILGAGILLAMISCGNPPQTFDDVPCHTDLPLKGSNLGVIFKPCKQYIYRAKYWDKNYELISDERIWMMATGKSWSYAPETQQEIAIQYETDLSRLEEIRAYTINPEFDQPWKAGEVTGVIETEDRTWMHPFRSNQYVFTEVAAFPYVILPLEKGNQWTSNINIYEGWGRWSDSSVEHVYRVLDFESVDTQFAQLEAWHVKASAISNYGTSIHDFWYHQDYGFVKMIVRNYEGQLVSFELSEIRE